MKTNIHFILNVMWYESKLINELFDSIQNALNYYDDIDLTLKLLLNSQTYWEIPKEGNTKDMFNEFINHPILKSIKTEITEKDDSSVFYGIGDWRREQYNKNGFTIWGESDCIIPKEFFHVIDFFEKSNIQKPYYVTLSHRKMWDDSWNVVEHPEIRTKTLDEWRIINKLYCCDTYITQKELDNFNDESEFNIIKLNTHKGDGASLILSDGIPTPFISPNLHNFGEDTCFTTFCSKKNIPQYHVDGLLKGHNTHHKFKRFNVISKNNHNDYDRLKQLGYTETNRWIELI